jgi:hypothetical protein
MQPDDFDEYDLKDLEDIDAIGNLKPDDEAPQMEPASILSLASGVSAADFSFTCKTRTHDLVRFHHAVCGEGGSVTLCDGDIKGVDGDKREHFDVLQILDVDTNLVWLSATRK